MLYEVITLIGWSSDYFMLKGIDNSIINGVPEYVIAMFQGKFAIITPALISGALAERVYFRGYFAFIAFWFLLIYCPLAHWIWAPDGWLANTGASGVIDLAGGLVIHVSAGTSALVAALFLGARRDYPKSQISPVITSYSIHYTKLYDTQAWIDVEFPREANDSVPMSRAVSTASTQAWLQP